MPIDSKDLGPAAWAASSPCNFRCCFFYSFLTFFNLFIVVDVATTAAATVSATNAAAVAATMATASTISVTEAAVSAAIASLIGSQSILLCHRCRAVETLSNHFVILCAAYETERLLSLVLFRSSKNGQVS